MKWILFLLLYTCSVAYAAIGNVTEQVGTSAHIQRNKDKVQVNKGVGVESNDAVNTAKTKLGITFNDNTKVQINEQSRLVIDDFVYDPNSKDAGKLGLKVALGTVRYASGQIAKKSTQNVAINTPTSTIAVRGTDFTMTVDEFGRSLIILLPSCPQVYKNQEECFVGEIEVITDVGSVIMNQAFQSTVTHSRSAMPTPPKLIDVNEKFIDNLLIVSPPKATSTMSKQTNDLDNKTELDQDLLEYQELAKNFLDGDNLQFSELDINRLDADYLNNMLDLISKSLSENALDTVDGVLPNIKSYAWIPAVYNEETIFLYAERPPHIADIKVERNTNGVANITQDGVNANIILNSGGSDVAINITQTQ